MEEALKNALKYVQKMEIEEALKNVQKIEEALKNGAEEGVIDRLYSLIKQNHSILDGLDAPQFVDTPLHIAARDGKAEFAMEIANLKPSLARKLNEDGLSPMHLALENEHWSIARGLVQVDKELVRVKGKGGRTPLHEVASTGNLSLLRVFLDACPASVEDTTVQLETALHLAVKKDKWEAFLLLLKSLKRQNKSEILSWGDNHGNTVLHVAVAATLENQHKFVKKLLWEDFQVNHVNTQRKTALDILFEQGPKHKLERPFRRAGALKFDEISSDHKRGIVYAMAEIGRRFFLCNFITYFRYNKYRDSPDSVRNALLVVATLIATATYQTGTTPPVDKWQNKFKPDHHNILGLSVKDLQFYAYLFINSLGFHMSLVMILILTAGFPLQFVLVFALAPMLVNYVYSTHCIAPQGHQPLIFFLFSYVFPILYTLITVLTGGLLLYAVKLLLWKIPTGSIREKHPIAYVEPQAKVRDAHSSVEIN